MRKSQVFRRVLKSVCHFATFFLLIAFVITCCLMLFVNTLSESLNVELTEENIQVAAKLTFLNVMLLSFVCTVIDAVRRKFTVSRPVCRITDAAEMIMRGDFSVRIPHISSVYNDEGFNQVIDCFNKMAQELSGAETLRTDFIANVSHELKTPLAVMQNYAVMLQKPDLTEQERNEYAKAISDSARRLADLISNILKLNKLENQQIFPEKQKFNLGEQLCECLLSFESVWESKAIEIETDIEEDVYVETDSELLSIVWNNLFSNALKFTEKGGKVSLKLRSDAEFAIVDVTDTGCGISKDVGERIFDKFYQGDSSHATQGNGLGLALVRRVADITASDIFVESELGRGSTFSVRIKRAVN